jgi:16S rRNA (uracil1498-N3)-methyltransferase
MNLFYHPQIQGDSVDLDEQESKHAIRVLRLKVGDRVILVDGRGGWYETEIAMDHPRRCQLKIVSHTLDYRPIPYHLHLAISPTKSTDRFEWFVEKATEIGVSEITPIICHRTERPGINRERLERVIISALKQSMRAFKPLLHATTSMDEFLKVKRGGTNGIAHCIPDEYGELTNRTGINDLPRSSHYSLLVGPEGDFTEEEVKLAMDAGYSPFHLGESRLRTETAGVYICSAISLYPG